MDSLHVKGLSARHAYERGALTMPSTGLIIGITIGITVYGATAIAMLLRLPR
jgi:hypothetical protein